MNRLEGTGTIVISMLVIIAIVILGIGCFIGWLVF